MATYISVLALLIGFFIVQGLAVVINQHGKQENNIDAQPCSPEKIESKEYDLVIFGAMGFTGKSAVYYLADKPDKLRWAIAGRNMKQLKNFVEHEMGDKGAEIGVIRADLLNEAELLDMTERTRMVLSFAGPYEEYGGEALIRAALQGCAHYVDVSRETTWKRKMHDFYAERAVNQGMAIVQSAGFEALAADFLAMSAAQDFVDTIKQTPSHIMVIWNVMNHGEAGGKIASNHEFIKDPYVLVPEVPKILRVDAVNDGHNLATSSMFGLYNLTQFAGASVDCPVIRRSLYTKFPEVAISVEEVSTTSLAESLKEFRAEFGDGLFEDAFHPNLQNQGQAPPFWMRTSGSFKGDAFAFHRDPQSNKDTFVKRVTLEGSGDPHYIATPKMAVELALGVLFDGAYHVGYLTPSTALGTTNLEHRLRNVDGGEFLKVTHWT